MGQIHFKLSIGKWEVNSQDDSRTELIMLDLNQTISSTSDVCRIAVFAAPAPPTDLIGQVGGALDLTAAAAESLTIQVRGSAITHGDEIGVELTAGDTSAKVMAAEVQSIQSSLGQTNIVGVTAKQRLAQARLNQIYQNQTLNQIVSDLASQCDVVTGQIETGQTYPYLVVDETVTVLNHLLALARRDGLDLYFDAENKLVITKFNKSNPDHTFHYGIDVLDLEMSAAVPTANQVTIYGESPSSNRGTDTWPWLAKDLSPFRADVGSSRRKQAAGDRALRTKDAASGLAKARMAAFQDGARSGFLKITGNPTLKLGDAFEIKSAPKPELNGLFKVVCIRHRLNKQDGFITTIGFTGQGGEKKTADLFGNATGMLAGAAAL